MRCRHSNWETPPVAAGVGLRQGSSAAPMLFPWVLQDALDSLCDKWTTDGKGVTLHTGVMAHIAWADDTWLLDATRAVLEGMLRGVAEVAKRQTGLVMRWEKCWVAGVIHRGMAEVTEDPPMSSFPLLSRA